MNGNPKQQPKSREYDFFPTHPLWTEALLNVERFTGTISEPCAGDGSMVKVLVDAGYVVDASDIRDYGAG